MVGSSGAGEQAWQPAHHGECHRAGTKTGCKKLCVCRGWDGCMADDVVGMRWGRVRGCGVVDCGFVHMTWRRREVLGCVEGAGEWCL